MFFEKTHSRLQCAGQNIKIKYLCIIALVLFVLSLVPLFLISPYNMPSADDYANSNETREVFLETGRLLPTMERAVVLTKMHWNRWQGTFATIFFMVLPPVIFADWLYTLVPFFMLGILIAGVFVLSRAVLRNIFGADKWKWMLVALWIAFFCIQTLPSPRDGFFWYTGALHYTVPFSLSLMVFAMLITISMGEKKRTDIVRIVVCSLFCVFTGGGNLITTLSTTIAFICLFVVLLIHKKIRPLLLSLIPFAVHFVCFLLNVLAPGNSLRQEYFGQPSFWDAIFSSLKQVPVYVYEWTTPAVLVGMLMLAPILWKIASQSGKSFRLPLLVPLGSWCYLAVGICPGMYALKDTGPERLVNVYYFTYILLLVFNLFYGLGWLSEKLEGAKTSGGQSLNTMFSSWLHKNALYGLVGLSFLFICLQVSMEDYRMYSSVAATYSLYTGEAADYSAQMRERVALYEDESLDVVAVEPLRSRPHLLFFTELSEDPNEWLNEALALYYGKEAVYLLPEEPLE